MSFTNDDERDGLASLFGGITPQAAPTEGAGRRRAQPEPSAAPTGQQAPPTDQSDAPQYPGLAPAAPAPHAPTTSDPLPTYPVPPTDAPPPTYVAPPTYDAPPAQHQPPVYLPSPAFTPEPPAFGATAEPPGFPPPAYTPPSHASAAEPPTAEPTGAFGEPVSPEPAQPAAPSYDPQPYLPPAYAAPVTPVPPGDPFGTSPVYDPPAYDRAAYDLPAPAAPPVSPLGVTPTSPPPDAFPQYAPPGQTVYPGATPYTAPEPLAEPPQFTGFAALGLEPVDDPLVGAVPVDRGPVDPLQTGQGLTGAEPSTSDYARGDVVEPAEPSAVAVLPASRAGQGSAPVLRRPPGPLLPTEVPALETADDLERATTLEKIGLGIAVIGGPIGLVLAIVNGIRGVRRRGWLTGVGRASLVIAVLSTIAAGIGGVALWNIRQAQLEHAEVAAASAEFCAAAAEHPEIVEPPYLGWPAPGATITESLALMQEWTTRWTDLAVVSPAGLRPGLEELASRGGEVIAAVEQSRLVNDEENKRLIGAGTGPSGIAGWHETYCVTS